MITAKGDSVDTSARTDAQSFDVEAIRRDFPILQQTIHGKPLVYLDNAATTQKPRAVIDAITNHYLQDNANIHRGVHELSVRATAAYEKVRAKVRDFIGADRVEEIVFLRSTTEAVNLVAQTYGHSVIQSGDEIVITTLEHHSNIVPWQMLCEQTGAVLKVAPINDAGEIILEEYEKLLGPRTMLVAATHVSNALGTITPIKEIIDIAHRSEVRVLVDGAQATPHTPVDVRDLDCDFYAFSSHKLFGPTGVGVLYGKYDLLNGLPPYQGGGEMILSVGFDGTTYNHLPYKFEAGTPNIAGVIGFGAAIDYINAIGMQRIAEYEKGLLDYATQTLSAIPGVRIIGTAAEKASVISFVVEGVHPHDVGTILDQLGIAVRTGHHCAQPLMERFGLTATARASFAFYNTRDEVDALADGIRQVGKVFGG